VTRDIVETEIWFDLRRRYGNDARYAAVDFANAAHYAVLQLEEYLRGKPRPESTSRRRMYTDEVRYELQVESGRRLARKLPRHKDGTFKPMPKKRGRPKKAEATNGNAAAQKPENQ
jgi:hypothetical protein